MKLTFIEALEAVLEYRDELIAAKNDRNTPHFMLRNSHDKYEDALRRLEEAHKISLLDVIAGEQNETQ